MRLCVWRIKTLKKIIVSAGIDFAQRRQDADTDIQLTTLIFFLGASADITAAQLQQRTELLLRKTMRQP